MPGREVEARPGPVVFVAHSDPEVVAGWFGDGLRAAGLTLAISTSGSELLERFDPGVPSCTLLDLLLPPSGGLDVLAKLRGRRPSAPVLMIGEAPTARVAVEAMRLGAADVLETAFDPHLLQMRILQLAERDGRSVLAERGPCGSLPSGPHPFPARAAGAGARPARPLQQGDRPDPRGQPQGDRDLSRRDDAEARSAILRRHGQMAVALRALPGGLAGLRRLRLQGLGADPVGSKGVEA